MMINPHMCMINMSYHPIERYETGDENRGEGFYQHVGDPCTGKLALPLLCTCPLCGNEVNRIRLKHHIGKKRNQI